ncbi:hypothetical protein RM543_15985 [Roseicyclus sp. F158]|uniref:Uncharacterized protein n=1 Tax=Tropicimonas omnivorans TaxID=3075590 RepID=A0ABU3DKD6_9RHOB|nr:hypothetical protein [Roseicyclus sp. F158]MDT0684185.1 hypothetical protein [Roseicyclus sp. F158]
MPRTVLRSVARAGEAAYRVSGGRLRGPLSLQDFATSAVEITLDMRKAERELGYAPLMS